MSTRAKGDEDGLEGWYEAFREQSADQDALGLLSAIYSHRLGGGKSGAIAALFSPTKGPIVLKWDSLERVVRESEVRRARPDQQNNMMDLRSRGASHIALRQDPASDALYGIMAYPYLGPYDPGADLVGDFEWFIRGKYLQGTGDNALRDDTLLWAYQELLARLSPSQQNDGETSPDVPAVALPDLEDWLSRITSAEQVSHGVHDAEDTLRSLADWGSELFSKQWKTSFPDSRLVHGDPRFANIMVDLEKRRVGLIDFGAGHPGGHIFKDLARFEVDILLRTTKELEGHERANDIAARGGELLRHEVGDLEHLRRRWSGLEPTTRVAAIWRHARNQTFLQLHAPKVRQLHALFIATELLRRLKWHAVLGVEADAGATVPELLLALRVLVSSVPA